MLRPFRSVVVAPVTLTTAWRTWEEGSLYPMDVTDASAETAAFQCTMQFVGTAIAPLP